MISSILAALSQFVIAVIETGGYAGIFSLMLLQSINIPIPSEVIMTFSGFLASQGIFNLYWVILAGAGGNLIGSLISYRLASFLVGNGLREKYRIIHFFLNDRSVEMARQWFLKYGTWGVFLGRIMPVINTFISFPAGLAKMPLKKFIPVTLAGALIWNSFLASVGFKLGENWRSIEGYFRKFDYVILIILLIGIAFWIRHHIKNHQQTVE